MNQLGTVRFQMKDLMSYWPTEDGVMGAVPVTGIFIALMLRGAPQIVRAGFNTEEERDAAIRKLDKARKPKAL